MATPIRNPIGGAEGPTRIWTRAFYHLLTPPRIEPFGSPTRALSLSCSGRLTGSKRLVVINNSGLNRLSLIESETGFTGKGTNQMFYYLNVFDTLDQMKVRRSAFPRNIK